MTASDAQGNKSTFILITLTHLKHQPQLHIDSSKIQISKSTCSVQDELGLPKQVIILP